MKKLKVAVIGVGGISGGHITAYMANPNVELYAFCDINAERLKYMGERYGITRLYTDEAEMLAELPELDAVSVCTWNSAHAPCTIMDSSAGRSFWKPKNGPGIGRMIPIWARRSSRRQKASSCGALRV